MSRALNLADIQGNIIRAYGGYGYPIARYFCLHIRNHVAGRAFVDAVRREVTTAERWQRGARDYGGSDAVPRPEVTVNIGFTFRGLLSLGLPTRTLRLLPDEYIDGMAKRADILGDAEASGIPRWDSVWRDSAGADSASDGERAVHIWISLNAQADENGEPLPALEEKTQWIRDLCKTSMGGVELLAGHGPQQADFQAAKALMVRRNGRMVASGKEHFGFSDGIGNPVFTGQYEAPIEAQRVIGRGKLMPDQSWAPLATGEFILGHADESQEIPPAAPPADFVRNGTFMVYRKLHQNTASFHDYIDRVAQSYGKAMGVDREEAAETVRAKMAGRWSDGVPLMAAPTYAEWRAFNDRWAPGDPQVAAERARALADFKYADDPDGLRCPITAHIRRVNTRDMLDPAIATGETAKRNGSALNKRRRILRRGLPYGRFNPQANADEDEHGIIFMAVCASIFRQFEFVQQQWVHYGLDFNAGNDTCPIVGNHDTQAKFVIASDPASGKPPFICERLPQFVTTRGGDYFFIPSITALRMIATGIVDPT